MKIDGVDFNFSSERHKSFPIRISLNRDITLKRQIITVIINHDMLARGNINRYRCYAKRTYIKFHPRCHHTIYLMRALGLFLHVNICNHIMWRRGQWWWYFKNYFNRILFLLFLFLDKKSLKIPKWSSEAVNRRGTNSTRYQSGSLKIEEGQTAQWPQDTKVVIWRSKRDRQHNDHKIPKWSSEDRRGTDSTMTTRYQSGHLKIEEGQTAQWPQDTKMVIWSRK